MDEEAADELGGLKKLKAADICSTCALRPPAQLRIPPVDALEHVSHLRRRDRYRAVRCRRPDKLAAVQTLGIERHAQPIMPKDLHQIAAAAPEDVEIATMRIALQALLHCESQASHAATHIGVASGDPDPDAARDRDHQRRSSSRTRCSASVSTSRSTRTRQPPSSISMIPALARSTGGEDGCGAHVDAEAGAEVISAGTSAGAAFSASRRHVNNWLVDNPLRRAVTDTNRGPL